jgi:CHAT domain
MSWMMEVRPTASGWEARLLDLNTRADAVDPATNNPFLPVPRPLVAIETPAGRFPLPPQQERPAPTDKLTRMTSGADPDLIADYFERTVRQSIDDEGMQLFGGYLFRTLLGEPLWERMRAANGNAEMELILSWSPALQELTRLPWEMMYGAKNFLLLEARVALARAVADAPGVLRPIQSPPRVLFVIGSTTERDFDGLKPGAEYFSLLRAIRQNGLSLNIFPLVSTTSEKLEVAMRRFQPDVVHFICHGNDDGTIDLVDARTGSRVRTSAGDIYDLLHPSNAPNGYAGPQIVVLNSCYSASNGGIRLADAGQVNFPLAISLVEKGVPVVLGMAGEVANQACRLFGRTFYESLLTDGMLPRAAAKGRRAGLQSAEGVRRIDWTLPTLFLSPAAAGVKVPLRQDPGESAWQALAELFAPGKFPAYYARLELLRKFGLLMLDEADQRKVDLTVTLDRQFLGISIAKKASCRFGRSWALLDLAAIAARNGHVPLLIEPRMPDWPPLTPEVLVTNFLRKAANTTSTGFGPEWKQALKFNWTNSTQVLKLAEGAHPTPDMAAEVADIYITGDRNERLDMLATAIRLDLIEYLKLVRTVLNRPDARLLMIFDDVHVMGDAALFLFKRLFGADSLRGERAYVRVLFSFVQQPDSPDLTPAVEAITEFLQSRYADEYQLTEFRSPTETRLAYENFLMHWRDDQQVPVALVPATENKEQVFCLFEALEEEICGIPDNLDRTEVRAVLKYARKQKPQALRDASDDEQLRNVP